MQNSNKPDDDFATQRAEFLDRGIIRVHQLIPASKVAAANEAALRRMESAEIWSHGSWQVGHLRDAPINAGAKFAKQLKGCPEFDSLVKDEIPDFVNRLLDRQPTFVGMKIPQPLFTLPNADAWSVPHMTWHLDAPRLPNWGIPGVQIFTFLESVKPKGGGTLAVAGSHRLLNGEQRTSSQEVRRQLKRNRYFQDLMSAPTREPIDRDWFLTESGKCDDVELRVVEMHGEPGDVYFVDLRTLHAAAPNATPIPRMMLTRRFYLEAVREMIFEISS